MSFLHLLFIGCHWCRRKAETKKNSYGPPSTGRDFSSSVNTTTEDSTDSHSAESSCDGVRVDSGSTIETKRPEPSKRHLSNDPQGTPNECDGRRVDLDAAMDEAASGTCGRVQDAGLVDFDAALEAAGRAQLSSLLEQKKSDLGLAGERSSLGKKNETRTGGLVEEELPNSAEKKKDQQEIYFDGGTVEESTERKKINADAFLTEVSERSLGSDGSMTIYSVIDSLLKGEKKEEEREESETGWSTSSSTSSNSLSHQTQRTRRSLFAGSVMSHVPGFFDDTSLVSYEKAAVPTRIRACVSEPLYNGAAAWSEFLHSTDKCEDDTKSTVSRPSIFSPLSTRPSVMTSFPEMGPGGEVQYWAKERGTKDGKYMI
jgi:hypothetical protein